MSAAILSNHIPKPARHRLSSSSQQKNSPTTFPASPQTRHHVSEIGRADLVKPNPFSARNSMVTFPAIRRYAGNISRKSHSKASFVAIATLMVLLCKILITVSGDEHDLNVKAHFETRVSEHRGHQASSMILTEPVLFKSVEDSLLLGLANKEMASRGQRRRLIFIGDIHGCIDELTALLAKVEYNKDQDHIITTGDMVNKGPNSAAVLEYLRIQKASCVRGNHDDKILHILTEARDGSHAATSDNTPASTVARSLSPDQIAYLQSCPVILHVGKLKGSDLVVVHAGLVPSVHLLEQPASHVMNMRTIDITTLEPSPKHEADGSVHWFELWNRYQTMSLAERRAFAPRVQNINSDTNTVVYGHDAKKGLQLRKYTRGLDTMCVRGGKLTALVISQGQDEQIIQVNCRDYIE